MGWLNSEDDLEAWRSPAQGPSHPGPQSDLICQAAAAHRHTFSTWQLAKREESGEEKVYGSFQFKMVSHVWQTKGSQKATVENITHWSEAAESFVC